MLVASALLRLIAIVALAAVLPCRAEDVISGRWEGTAHIPDDELTVIVDLAQENGAWAGSIIIPGLDVKGVPLTDVAVKPPDVSFSVKSPLGIRMKLRLDGNGKMTGNFEQAGNAAPTSLQKAGPPQVEHPPRNTPVAKELEGEWKGDYQMLGYTRHVSIKFTNRGSDGAVAEFVIVGRRINNLPVDLVTQEGDLVTVDSRGIGFSFEGRLKEGKLSGAIRQGAIETPVLLERPKELCMLRRSACCSRVSSQRQQSMRNRCFAAMPCTPASIAGQRHGNFIA